MRILIAEDEAITLKHLSYALGQEGFAVTGVGNGLDALRTMEGEQFDLLIADIKMPGMDGLTLLAEVRAKYAGTDVKVDGDELLIMREDDILAIVN